MINVYPPHQKPPMWAPCDPGVVAYNAARMGLPMPLFYPGTWEGSGGKSFDLSGNSYDLIITGADWIENNLSIATQGDYLFCAIPKTLSVFTIRIYIYQRGAGLGTNYGYLWGFDSGNRLSNEGSAVLHTCKLDATAIFITTDIGIKNNSWNDIFLTCNGSTTKTYVNGVITGTFGVAGTLVFSNFYFGNSNGADRTTDCLYTSEGIWDVALVESQVATLSADPYGLVRQPRRIWGYVAVPPIGAIMNQFQGANLGADLFNGTLL